MQEAEGEAQRFISVYDEYAKAPDVTRKRLYLETMEKVLEGLQQGDRRTGQRARASALSAAAGAAEARDAAPPATGSELMANRLPIIGVIAAVILFLIYSSVFVVNAAPAGDRAALRRDRRRQDASPASTSRRRSPSSTPTTCRSSRTGVLRFDLDNIRVQVSGGKFYEVDAFVAYRISDPRVFRAGRFGQRRTGRSSGCGPVSTLRCAASTVCAASKRRCRKSAPR